MAYSVEDLSENCYPGTTVLINKLNIRSQSALDDIERVTTGLHTVEIEKEDPAEPFTFAYYKSLHKRLFGDLYDWAGENRKVDLSKKGTVFCKAENLEEIGTAIFNRLQRKKEFRDLNRKAFVKETTELYNSINMLHPFREGNGRTQRLFFTLLIRRAGHDINFSIADPDELMVATIYAAQGITDQLLEYFNQAIIFSDRGGKNKLR